MNPRVEIVRSQRRRKTLSARHKDGYIEVRVPAGMTPDDEARHVARLVERVTRKVQSNHVDLEARARDLARRYKLQEPISITWSHNQDQRWGSCSTVSRRIRISDRLAEWPPWVLDYVIVHELAHLDVADHGRAFEEIVSRYPLTERARGYLIAKS